MLSITIQIKSHVKIDTNNINESGCNPPVVICVQCFIMYMYVHDIIPAHSLGGGLGVILVGSGGNLDL